MSSMHQVLKQELCRLANAGVDDVGPLVITGGFGLTLRLGWLRESGREPLGHLPNERTTEDIDLLLPIEFISDPVRVAALRDAILRCGYEVRKGREFYQFQRHIDYRGQRRAIRIDLLAATPVTAEQRAVVKIKRWRIRPHRVSGLHAYRTPEALMVHEQLQAIEIDCGHRRRRFYVPHPTSYVIMKLFAFRDRVLRDSPAKSRHAIDLYRLAVSTTREEMITVPRLVAPYRERPEYQEATRIVERFFASPEAPGTLIVRNSLSDGGMPPGKPQVRLFVDLLHELLDLRAEIG